MEITVATTLDAGLPADAVRCAACMPYLHDAFGEPRTRYVRVTLGTAHCIMHPSEGDSYLKDAHDSGDRSKYVVTDVYLSEREFDDLSEFVGF
jgi:hypothetical protein